MRALNISDYWSPFWKKKKSLGFGKKISAQIPILKLDLGFDSQYRKLVSVAHYFMMKLWPLPPTPLLIVNVLYKHPPRRPCLHDYHICTYVQILIEFDCSAIHNAIMNRKSMMKQNQDFCNLHTYYVNSEFPKI